MKNCIIWLIEFFFLHLYLFFYYLVQHWRASTEGQLLRAWLCIVTSIVNPIVLITHTGVLYDSWNNAWLGLHDDNNGNDWHWVDGSPYLYVNWGDGEPNNSQEGEHCGEVSTAWVSGVKEIFTPYDALVYMLLVVVVTSVQIGELPCWFLPISMPGNNNRYLVQNTGVVICVSRHYSLEDSVDLQFAISYPLTTLEHSFPWTEI